MFNEHGTARPFPSHVGIGKMFADIAHGHGAKQGIDEGMEDHVAVAVGNGADLRGDLHAAQNKGFVWGKAVDVET